MEIYLSVITGIDSITKLEWFANSRSLKGIYIHENLLRRLKKLRYLANSCKERNIETCMIVNSLCDVNCPNRAFHHDLVSHSNEGKGIGERPFLWYYASECNLRRLRETKYVLTLPWVRPDDIPIYVDSGISKLKVAGRDLFQFHPDFIRVVKEYNRGHYEGNLFDLILCYAQAERSDLFTIINNDKLDQ